MADKLEGNPPSRRSRSTDQERSKPKPATPKPNPVKPKLKAETPILADDLTGKFLRVGNKLYRTSDDKKPIVKLEPDRLKTSNIDALPDILRIAKASGWTSIKLNGGDKFKKAAYLAANAQGFEVENYTPSKIVRAEAERLRARLAEREARRASNKSGNKLPRPADEANQHKTMSERFLSQTHEQNARDPALRHAQSLVAQTMSVARVKYPDDPVKAAKDVEAKRQDVARRIANGNSIAAVQVRNQQAQRVREITQEQALGRDARSR